MYDKLMNVLLGGALLFLAAGCAAKVVNPAEMTDQTALDRKIDLAIADASETGELRQYWDSFLPYISLTNFADDAAGIWMSSLVDKDGNLVWYYTSEQDKYWVNMTRIQPKITEEIAGLLPTLDAGDRAWGKVETGSDYHYVLYFSPVPEEAQIDRPGAAHPQYLVLMVVEPQLDEY